MVSSIVANGYITECERSYSSVVDQRVQVANRLSELLVDEGYQASPKGSYRAGSAVHIILSVEQYDVARIWVCICG
jgi:hypothetical protein